MECSCNIARGIDLGALVVLGTQRAKAGVFTAETVVDTLHEAQGGFGERLHFIGVLPWEN